MAKENLNEGRRSRLKERYLREGGLDGFHDHEIIELLLYYCYPRQDTNKIAHKLIKEFGSIHNLYESTPEHIARKGDVSINVAILVSMVRHLARGYEKSKWGKKMLLDNSMLGGEFCISLFTGRKVEALFIICLDSNRKLIYPELASEGTINEAPIYIRELVEIALKHQSTKIIIAHNHPGGNLRPSIDDIAATKKVVKAMELIGIEVLDHIIVARSKYYSFSEHRTIPMGYG
jgi:DNA repair protein RadC